MSKQSSVSRTIKTHARETTCDLWTPLCGSVKGFSSCVQTYPVVAQLLVTLNSDSLKLLSNEYLHSLKKRIKECLLIITQEFKQKSTY